MKVPSKPSRQRNSRIALCQIIHLNRNLLANLNPPIDFQTILFS